jgi:glycosyltransferase involved in cell wall biosynthesis
LEAGEVQAAAALRPRRILMVAYHFPPLAGSSGIQRTLRFVQHLPAFGWQPIVLSAHPRAYEKTSADLLGDVPASVPVHRAFALDTARHLAIGGRYVAAMARPDRWASWQIGAVWQGLRLIRRYKPDIIWSTYPIATAHLIGAELSRRSGIPWVADFRDPMAQESYPADPLTWKQFKAIEERALREASLSTFTTPGAARLYAQRYPEAAERIALLENGYDEEAFAAAAHADEDATPQPLNPGATTLLHSGIVYPDERDPTQLFVALQRLKEAGRISRERLRVRFRAAVHDDLLRALAERHAVQDFVEICPPMPYRDALREMQRADALLVLQASNCNEQIPAKIYEYLRTRRPILCLSDPAGDTESALRSAGVQAHARLNSADEIGELIGCFVSDSGSGQLARYLPTELAVTQASRAGRAQALAAHLDRLAARR